MADVRALLKAKRQEARITHPYAAYGASGALRCTACGAAIKFASAWEGHLGSKAHRVAVASLKAKEEAARHTKRKAEEQEEEEEDGDHDQDATTTTTTKRQRTEEREILADDDDDGDAHAASHAFPVNFFSDPARAPPRTTTGDGDEDDEMDQDDKKKGDVKSATATATPPKSQFDMEWAAFEREMQGLSHQRRRPAAGGNDGAASEAADPQETTYAHATIAAEPELVPRFEGLPVSSDTGAEEAEQGTGTGLEERRKKVSSEEEERRRKEREERELIMDRLVEEERAQEDAYGRVALLKNRIQMLKQKRELAKAKGKKADVDMEEA
jgi:zinc finger protein 830